MAKQRRCCHLLAHSIAVRLVKAHSVLVAPPLVEQFPEQVISFTKESRSGWPLSPQWRSGGQMFCQPVEVLFALPVSVEAGNLYLRKNHSLILSLLNPSSDGLLNFGGHLGQFN